MIDRLGHPIEVGVTVLTNGYYTSSMEVITTVKRITPKAIIVDVVLPAWVQRYNGGITTKEMRKQPHQILVIEQQLAYNQREYPENMI